MAVSAARLQLLHYALHAEEYLKEEYHIILNISGKVYCTIYDEYSGNVQNLPRIKS
jgi:hypothetical protein